MTKYVYGEHFTQKDHDKVVKANIYMLPQFNVQTKYYNSDTRDETIATGIQVFLKNNYTNTTRRGVSDDYGQVTFYDVPAGDYELKAVDKTGIYGDAVKNITLNRESSTSETLLLYTPFIPEFTFYLLDNGTYEPIEGLELTIETMDGTYKNSLVSNSEGICLFKKIPTGNYFISTKPTPYYNEYFMERQLTPDYPDYNCYIQSHLVKQFKVQVKYETQSIPNANIKIHHNETSKEFTGTSGEDGTYTFTNIINGQYTVSLSHQEYRAEDQTITVRTQEEGEVEDLLMEPKYGNARIIIQNSETEEPIPDVTAKMVSADEGIPTLTKTSGEDGIIQLENVYLGKYNVLCTNKYYDDTFTIVELDHDSTTTISMDVIELDNIKFKVVNKWGNKELLDHKEVQFFKKANPTEEDQPDYTVEVEDGYTNRFIIPAGKYTVKFHDNDTMYDWVSDDYIPSFVDKFLYNVDLNKTTQEQTVELEGNLLPELKIHAFNVGGYDVDNYKFHFEGESPFTMTGFLTSDWEGKISTKYSVVYGSKVRVYCYDAGTYSNEIVFDEEFVIDTWDEDYVKEITIGARHIPKYALRVNELDKDSNEIPIKGGTQVLVKTGDGVSVTATVDGTNGVVYFNNILKEEDTIEIRLNSSIYAGFYSGIGMIVDHKELVTHYYYADEPGPSKTVIASRHSISMDVLCRNKNNYNNVSDVNVKVIANESLLYVQDYDKYTELSGKAHLTSVVCGNYSYTATRTAWKTVTGTFDIDINDSDSTKIIEMEPEITVTVSVKDQFRMNIKKGTITATQSGKSYTATISNGNATLKVNATGNYSVTITSDDTDSAGNKVHNNFSGQFTVPADTTSASASYTITRKTATVNVRCYSAPSYIKNYYLEVIETGATYNPTSSSYFAVSIPAGTQITIYVKYGSSSDQDYFNLNCGGATNKIFML